eukprot:TRINITY_DN1850_c0_g1_i1.p1 TRINITY_DN1850_c0_g1~~TRINITY_DN1850_c0_g1_i1.p1  ORF type:complete len:218 (-),score=46.54 TRINITY_DN1850_c0_g1_i1:138-791(-)
MEILQESAARSKTGKPDLVFALPRLPGRSARQIGNMWKQKKQGSKSTKESHPTAHGPISVASSSNAEIESERPREKRSRVESETPDTMPSPKRTRLVITSTNAQEKQQQQPVQSPAAQSQEDLADICEALVGLKRAPVDADRSFDSQPSLNTSLLNSSNVSEGSRDYGRLVAKELKRAVDRFYPNPTGAISHNGGQIIIREKSDANADPNQSVEITG